MSNGDAESARADSPARHERLLDNPWLVLALLFFVMAALGIPVFWMSRAFSTPLKLILTVVVTLYTLFLFWLVWLVLAWSYTRIQDSLG